MFFRAFGGSAAGLDLFKSLAASGEFGDDGVHGGGPDKGFPAFLFQTARKSSIAATRSSTQRNDSRRIRLLVSSANERSIRFSQLQLVGT